MLPPLLGHCPRNCEGTPSPSQQLLFFCCCKTTQKSARECPIRGQPIIIQDCTLSAFVGQGQA